MTSLHSQTDENEYELRFGDSGYLRIPIRIAERHLTESTEDHKAEVQPIGTHLQILIRSEREDMLIRIPFQDWETGDTYSRSLSGWTLNLKRWVDNIEVSGESLEVKVYSRDEF